jgi:hypothetical protein
MIFQELKNSLEFYTHSTSSRRRAWRIPSCAHSSHCADTAPSNRRHCDSGRRFSGDPRFAILISRKNGESGSRVCRAFGVVFASLRRRRDARFCAATARRLVSPPVGLLALIRAILRHLAAAHEHLGCRLEAIVARAAHESGASRWIHQRNVVELRLGV